MVFMKQEKKTMMVKSMNLEVLLPSRIFVRKERVLRIVADTRVGSFGFLPNRLDCVMSLMPGILVYEIEHEGEAYIAVDRVILVKAGPDVFVSVHHATGGVDLGQLEEAVKRDFLTLDEREQSVRNVLAKLESGFIRQFAEFRNE